MTAREIRDRLLLAGIPEAQQEALILLSAYTGLPPAALVGQEVDCCEPDLLLAVRRREAHEPLGYILGEVPFYHGTLRVTSDCLIPRADTERLVELATSLLPRSARFCDLCTGSGAIAVTVLAERPDTTAVATDISAAALSVARENAVRYGVLPRLSLFESDLMVSMPEGRFDAILSNPPYIRTDVLDGLSQEVRAEPRIALDGGEDGLAFYRRILSFSDSLTEGGFFLLEAGFDQEEALASLAASLGYSFSPYRDYGHRFRGAVITP